MKNNESYSVIGQIIRFENNTDGGFNYRGFVWFTEADEDYYETFYTDLIDTDTYLILDKEPAKVIVLNIFAEFEIQPSLNAEIRFVKIIPNGIL